MKEESGTCNACVAENVLIITVDEVSSTVREIVINIWNETSFRIKHQNRFFYTEFFEQILSSALFIAEGNITRNFVLFRSRIEGIKDELGNVTGPYPVEEMGAPSKANSRNGRANVRGITCLYTASDMETAIAEVRPWKGAFVTVARVITNTKLKILNLVDIERHFRDSYNELTLQNLINYYLLLLIGFDLSKPVSTMDISEVEYVPTQIFTEFIKFKGYDGIVYKSSLGAGDNIVIFDESNITIIDSQLTRVNNIHYEIES